MTRRGSSTGAAITAAALAALLCRLSGLGAPPPVPVPLSTSTAVPTATPPPGTAKELRERRGGPLTFGISGNLALGERSQSSTFGSSSQGASQNEGNVGLLFQLSRRTASTESSFSFPLGVANQGPTRFGAAQLAYSTPKLGLTYQQQPLGLLGQVPLGSTIEGLGLILPIGSGDLTAFQGPVLIEDQQTARLIGLRARRISGATVYEAGLMQADAETSPERDRLALLGFTHASGSLDETLEAALENRSDAQDGANGDADAMQFRSDFPLPRTAPGDSNASLTLRRQSSGFLALGTGELGGDSFGDLSLRRTFGTNVVSVDESLDQSGGLFTPDSTSVNTISRRDSFNFTSALRWGDIGFAVQDQRALEAGVPQWSGSAGGQLQLNVLRTGALFQVQLQRTTGITPGSNAQYGVTLQRQIGPLALFYSGEMLNSTAQGTNSLIAQNQVQGTARIGARTSLSFGTTFMRTRSAASHALQITPLVNISRAISPVLSLGVNFGETFTHDPIDPAYDGHSRVFSMTINAPFAFGSGTITGRANPHLPAIISGSVISAAVANGFTGAAASSSNGLSNIEVVLDDSQVQRTDLLGRFQFNFVTPGHHEVRVETASLPRGAITDQPYASVNVAGGQSAQVTFQVGDFGGIDGHVMGRSPDGSVFPIAGAQVKLDSLTTVSTDALGSYGFGRLTSGKHTVTLDLASLPAYAGFPQSQATQNVTVQSGSYTNADFVAAALGSIAGKVVYDAAALGKEYAGFGVNNAYVVAEPGEHAAITDDDGTFLIDDLPPGNYTVDVDPETLPDGTGSESPAVNVDLQPGEDRTGLLYRIGKEQKNIIFTFRAAQSAPVALIALSRATIPPGGEIVVSVTPGESAKRASVRAFGASFPMRFVSASGQFEGTIQVPPALKAGTYPVVAQVQGRRLLSASASLVVDPQAPIAYLQLSPEHPARNQYVTVHARFFADVHSGDRIEWQDGQTTILRNPIAPHVFAFTVKISEQPYHGILLTKVAKLPITLR